MSRLRASFFKPNKDNSGALAAVEGSERDGQYNAFAYILPQVPSDGEFSKFNPEAKITVKLGVSDLGEMLTVLQGLKKYAGPLRDGKPGGLFHKNANGNSVIMFTTREDGSGYFFGLSSKQGNDQATRYFVNLSLAEGIVLERLLIQILDNSLVDTWQPQSQNATTQSNPTPAPSMPAPSNTPAKKPGRPAKASVPVVSEDIPF